MNFATQTHPHAEITEKIISACFAVLNDLGPGLDEKIYENALCIELAERTIGFSQQKQYAVHYKGRFVGKLIPDLIVNRCVVVDLKVVEDFNKQHEAQMLGYLAITGLEIGLLLNFHKPTLGVRRLARLKKRNHH